MELKWERTMSQQCEELESAHGQEGILLTRLLWIRIASTGFKQ